MVDNNDNESVNPIEQTPEGEGGQEASVTPEEETAVQAPEEAQVSKAELADLVAAPGEGLKNNLDLLMDVTVPLTVELGRSTMKIEDVIQLLPGSVIELDKRADEAIDLKVNGKLVARGEIVVVEDFFGIRVSEIVEPGEVES